MLGVWRRSVVAVAPLVALLSIVGAAYQALATARDEARFPMPGQRIDVGGRALHLYCVGNGPTTVLLENGLGGVYPAWRLVQSQVASFARACSYDRAGFGWSDPVSSDSVRAQSVAEDLARLVAAAGLTPPFILVGWSAGGVYVRTYYHEHPAGVIGMVLVDSSHEQQAERLDEPNGARSRRDAAAQLQLCRALAWSGIVRASNVMGTMAAPLQLPSPLRDEFVAMENRTSYCAADLKELVGFGADISQREPPASLGDLPLVVISRGRRTTEHVHRPHRSNSAMRSIVPGALCSAISQRCRPARRTALRPAADMRFRCKPRRPSPPRSTTS